MNSINLIRNKWFLSIVFPLFLGIVWVSFQMVYKTELILREIYKDDSPPDTAKIMMVYNEMMKSKPGRKECNSYYYLVKILSRAEKKNEMIHVLRRLVKTVPEDRHVRFWLALELHNQKKYREAEKHFVILLKKESKDKAFPFRKT